MLKIAICPKISSKIEFFNPNSAFLDKNYCRRRLSDNVATAKDLSRAILSLLSATTPLKLDTGGTSSS